MENSKTKKTYKMKGAVICGLLFLLANFGLEGNCVRNFWKGRRKGGNLGDPAADSNLIYAAEDMWFTQLLDSFDPTNGATWQQRYFVNDQFYNGTGPIFLMIGGEGEATAKWMHEGAWIHYAQEFGALCFQLEHRYYGKSHPTENLSTENLLFLASEQALQDLAYFITEMNKKYKLQVKLP